MEGIKDGYIYFYRAKPSHAWHKGMKTAVSLCKKSGLKAEWVSPEELADMTLPSKDLVLVIPEFLPEYMNNIDESFRIVGPFCLIDCLNSKIPVPNNNSPVFFLGMKGVVVHTTKMTRDKKNDIVRLVGYMGGSYSDVFSKEVTHLITDRAAPSEKLTAAIENDITIVKSSWIYSAWERGPEGGSALDIVNDHKLSPFTGLQITISGLSQSEKRRYSQLIEAHGGKYNPSLVQNITDVVVTNEGAVSGAKVTSAIAWGIPCVKATWIQDCAANGHPIPIARYAIHHRPRCSTPTKSDLPSFMGSEDISVVHGGSEMGGNINDTTSSVGSTCAWKPPASYSTPGAPRLPSVSSQQGLQLPNSQWLDELSLSEVQKAGLFLDGCKIYLAGWQQNLDRVSRIMIKAGATILEAMSERVTHAIAANYNSALPTLAYRGVNCVNLGWVVASMKEGKTVPADQFLFKMGQPCKVNSVQKPVPASPLSSKGLQLLKSRKTTSTESLGVEELNQAPDPCPSPAASGAAVSRKLFNTPKKSAPRDTEETQMTVDGDLTYTSATLFQGLVFSVVGFDEESASANIIVLESCGATVISSGQSGRIIDYAIVPIEGTDERISAAEVVTPLWIDDCRDMGKVVDVAHYHRPVAISSTSRLNGCVICLTGFPGRERLFLGTVASALGAVVQDAFSRRDMPKKGVVRSTHLLASEASGQKFEAAQKWGIPAVTYKWLLEAAKPGEGLPSEVHYSLGTAAADITQCAPPDSAKENVPVQCASMVQLTPASKASTGSTASTISRKPSCSSDGPAEVDVQAPADNASLTLPPLSLKRVSDSNLDADATPPKRLHQEDVSKVFGKPSVSPLQAILRKKSVALTPDNLSFNSSRATATPDTPYGAAFHDDPSPSTRKHWKKYIEHFPCLSPDPPIPPRRNSTPLNVIKMQLRAKVGGEVDGIEKFTGKILKDGPYAEWAKDSPSSESRVHLPEEETGANKTPVTSKPPPEPSKSSNKAVNELINLMSEIRQSNASEVEDGGGGTEDIDELARRLCKQPSVSNDHGDHPLNKLRPNSDAEFEAERPAGDYSDSEETAGTPGVGNTSHRKYGSPGTSSNSNPATSAHTVNRPSSPEEVTQPLNIEDDNETPVNNCNKLFVLSNLQAESKEKYEGIVVGLGGRVGTSGMYEFGTTHLIIEKPLRNEKLLCSIAAGNWVLHHSYLDMCYEARTFLDEEDYEFGNSRSECRLPKLEPGTQSDLAGAAYRWRKRVAALGQKAFQKLVVALFVRESSLAMFSRLLRAGDAKIVSNPVEANLVLVEEGKVSLPEKMSDLIRKRIPVVPPVYLSIYLIKFPRVDPFDHLISAYPKSS